MLISHALTGTNASGVREVTGLWKVLRVPWAGRNCSSTLAHLEEIQGRVELLHSYGCLSIRTEIFKFVVFVLRQTDTPSIWGWPWTCFVALAGLKFETLLPQTPDCCDYSHVAPHLSTFQHINVHNCRTGVYQPLLKLYLLEYTNF